ncbi:MAG TPA: hypothetical protein VJ201_08720, partial [Candidatus Babeliales bacterium]|nr:hypothetical protein [Candidatus Babeliales bacterium]
MNIIKLVTKVFLSILLLISMSTWTMEKKVEKASAAAAVVVVVKQGAEKELIEAVKGGYHETVKKLLSDGKFDVNVRDDEYSSTALMWA